MPLVLRHETITAQDAIFEGPNEVAISGGTCTASSSSLVTSIVDITICRRGVVGWAGL